MKKYIVTEYVRGVRVIEVEATDEDHAEVVAYEQPLDAWTEDIDATNWDVEEA